MHDSSHQNKSIDSSSFADNSVGVVEPQFFKYANDFVTSGGVTLPGFELIFETYGKLNSNKDNAILVCHALSGDHHAAGHHKNNDNQIDARPGWWDNYIGPNKAIDTNRFFVVSVNNLGGCAGSTGPVSINPATNQAWGPDFPIMRVRDWVHSQHLLMQHLDITQWAAVVGGSLGGMQAMRWSIEYPSAVRHCVVIAAAVKLSAQNIGFNDTARTAITSDPEFFDGHYLEHNSKPRRGVALARMIGHITYLSDDLMGAKFGRELRSGSFTQGQQSDVEFQIESYLHHQGDKFADGFDANTYLTMLRALDYFDLAREYNDSACDAFKNTTCDFLVVSFSSDWRFAPDRSQEIVDALIAAERNVTYANIESSLGHDAFLLPVDAYNRIFSAYMKRVADARETS